MSKAIKDDALLTNAREGWISNWLRTLQTRQPQGFQSGRLAQHTYAWTNTAYRLWHVRHACSSWSPVLKAYIAQYVDMCTYHITPSLLGSLYSMQSNGHIVHSRLHSSILLHACSGP